MRNNKKHLIPSNSTIKQALESLNNLSFDTVLFITDDKNKLLGSITDGDIRRGLLNGFKMDDFVIKVMNSNPKVFTKGQNDFEKVIEFRNQGLKIIPVVDNNNQIIKIINFRKINSYLPLDTVIMAGGRGTRLRPLTNKIPKPMIKVGNKPILEHNLDRLASFGIDDFWISLNYLGEQIQEYFQDGQIKGINIKYVREDKAMGTIGALSKIKEFRHNYILLTNSDLLSNINYEKFFLQFIQEEADLLVLSIPYNVSIPYAVLETNKNNQIKSYKEKPNYTINCNGGVYLFKKDLIKYLPGDSYFDATDFIEILIKNNHKVISYSFSGYWLDVGKPADLKKAQIDINKSGIF